MIDNYESKLMYNFGFQNSKSDIIISLVHWQFWWWFWFCFLISFYYVLLLKTICNRPLKFYPKINNSFRTHGKWGDVIVCVLPVIWCLNILTNSSTLLKLIEWQSEASLLTLRIRGKQWYWVYKLDLHYLFNNSYNVIIGNKKIFNIISKLSNTNFYTLKYDNFNFQNNYNNIFMHNKASNNTFLKHKLVFLNSCNIYNYTNLSINYSIFKDYNYCLSIYKIFNFNINPNLYMNVLNITRLYFYALDNSLYIWSKYLSLKLPNNNTICKENFININRMKITKYINFFIPNIKNHFSNDLLISLNNRESISNNIVKLTKNINLDTTTNDFSKIKTKKYYVLIQKRLDNWTKKFTLEDNFSKNDFFNFNLFFNDFVGIKISNKQNLLSSNRLLNVNDILILPTNTHINVITNSFDVVHSWFVPGLGFKMDCVPGRSTHHSLYIDYPGLYYGQCAEICGRFHHHMPIKICALDYSQYMLYNIYYYKLYNNY